MLQILVVHRLIGPRGGRSFRSRGGCLELVAKAGRTLTRQVHVTFVIGDPVQQRNELQGRGEFFFQPQRLYFGQCVVDAQFVEKRFDFLWPETRNLEQFNEARIHRGLELFKEFQFSGLKQLGDLLRERVANSLHGQELICADQPRQFSFLK